MVGAARLERRHEADRAELLQARLVEVEMLERPLHLLAGHRPALAEMLLSHAHRFRGDDAEHDAAVVVDGADPRLVLHFALALRVNVLADLLDHRVFRSGDVEARGDEAFRRGTGRNHVLLGAGPPYADHLGAREADLCRRLEGGGIHHAPAPEDHPVRADLAYPQPLRLLLVARVRHRNRAELVAVLRGEVGQHRDRLLAVGRIVV